MDILYSENLRGDDKVYKKKSHDGDFEETLDNYLNIWQINPSFKDINTNLAALKVISLTILTIFFIVSAYLLSLNLILSVCIGFIVLIGFISVFRDNFFNLKFSFRKFINIDPFEKLFFFLLKDDSNTLFFTNRKDLKTSAMSIFKVKVIPENVSPTLNKFIRSLNELKIPYSYQVAQIPLFEPTNNRDYKDSARKRYHINSITSFQTIIYFSIFYDIAGILSQRKMEILRVRLREYRDAIKSNFSANFYHFNIKLLSGDELLRALRGFILKVNTNNRNNNIPEENDYKVPARKSELPKTLSGLILCSFLVVYTSYILLIFGLSLLIIVIINLLILIIVISLWWRELLFQFSRVNLNRIEGLTAVNPFKNIDFYRFKEHPDSIFLHINKKILVNVKMLNLKYASPLFHNKLPFCYPNKFYRPLINQKIPFTYTLDAAPLSYYMFDKEAYKYLNIRSKYSIVRVESDEEGEDWLAIRGGVWKTILTISAFSYVFTNFTNFPKINEIISLENELTRNIISLLNNFKMNYHSFQLVPLKNQKLISGFLLQTLKNKHFRLGGTHLNYLFFQGKALILLTEISPEFRRSVETRIAAEFNTPLQLENFITFGHTFNTEFLEEEVPVGFLLEQLHNLLIVNGSSRSREVLAMKLVSELVKAQVPSLVFDFNGNWSKLINYFNGSRYEDEFLYFKLGSAFKIDLIRSGDPYDVNNTDYLDYMFDAYALAFKKYENTMDMFKNTILRNPDIDISTLNLELKNVQDWKKSPITDTMISLFDEFTQRDIAFFHNSRGENREEITFLDFIKDDRTVIIDLSISNEFKKQVFIMFVLLSKIIHYIKNNNDFLPKFIVAPHLDLFFEGLYLDKTSNYGKIDKFLDPLRYEGFGMIFSANQVRYLHNNVFNYFSDMVAFRTTDKRDIAVLKNQMSLQELHGTGYYSTSRNNSYQIDYLMSMKSDEALIKRSDIYQTFPAKIDAEEIQKITPMEYDEIVEYMKRQGYDLMCTEKRLLEQTKKTIFEKDLGSYSMFLEEIIKFLKALKSMDKIGNLYKAKIKEELKKSIYKKAVKITKNKKKLETLRDELFNILVTHGYLVESHPKSAGGSQSIATSYAVGDKYQIAVDDYFEMKNSLPDVYIETLEKSINTKDNIKNIFTPTLEFLKEADFENALAKSLSQLYQDLFKIHKFVNNDDCESALKIEKELMQKFLINLYKELYNVNYMITEKDLEDFTIYLTRNKKLPFSHKEFQNYLNYFDVIININEHTIELHVREAYELFSKFFNQIQTYLEEK